MNNCSIYFLCKFCLLICCPFFETVAQLNTNNYEPIRFKGTIPARFLGTVAEKTALDINNLPNVVGLDEAALQNFYSSSNHELQQLFVEGQLYFNDTISSYVQGICKMLLPNNSPEVYISKQTFANASTWRDGTLVVNIGLLSRLENEAQLAFVLAHELQHYLAQHSLLQYHSSLLNNGVISNSSHVQAANTINYSQQHELEADSAGFYRLTKSVYDATTALSLLQLLTHIDTPIESNFPTILRQLTTNILLYLPQNWINTCEKTSFSGKKSNTTTSQSHPDISLRITKMKNYLQDYTPPSNAVKNSEAFNHIQTLCRFELIEQAYLQAQYGYSLYACLMLLQEYPNNNYLREIAVQSMYWLAYYEQAKSLHNVITTDIVEATTSYGQFLCLIKQLHENNTLLDLAGHFIQEQYNLSPSNQIIHISYGQVKELQNAKIAARDIYRKYLETYPQGLYRGFVWRKLEAKR